MAVLVRVTVAGMGRAALRQVCRSMSSGLVMRMLIAALVMCVMHVMRHMCGHSRRRCNGMHGVMCRRTFDRHGITCQATQGQQQHDEQGQNAAHVKNDTCQWQLVPQTGLMVVSAHIWGSCQSCRFQ